MALNGHLDFLAICIAAVAIFLTSMVSSTHGYEPDMKVPIWVDPNQHFETPSRELTFRDGTDESHANMVRSLLKELDKRREDAKGKWSMEFFEGKLKCEERSGPGYEKHGTFCPVPRAELYNAASIQFEAGQHLKTLAPSVTQPRLAYVNLMVHACEGFVLAGFYDLCEHIWEVAFDMQTEGKVHEATVLYDALHASKYAAPFDPAGLKTVESFIEALQKDSTAPRCEEWSQKPLFAKGGRQEGSKSAIATARDELVKKYNFEECGVIDAQSVTPNKFFHNFILKSRPAIIRGLPQLPGTAGGGSAALTDWIKRFGDQVVSGWSTPIGDFYGTTHGADSKERAIRPAEFNLKFSKLIELLQYNTSDLGAVFYGQHMNLHREIPELAKEFQNAEAASPLHALPLRRVNLWVAPTDEKIRSRFHYDSHDSLLFPLQCGKEFFMFPPGELDNLYYSMDNSPKSLLWKQTWPNISEGGTLKPGSKIEWKTEELEKPIPNAAQVDLLAPDSKAYPKFLAALPRMKRCEVRPGDALYVPAYWHHEVRQLMTENCRCLNVAINYWHRPVLNLVTAAQAANDQPMEL